MATERQELLLFLKEIPKEELCLQLCEHDVEGSYYLFCKGASEIYLKKY